MCKDFYFFVISPIHSAKVFFIKKSGSTIGFNLGPANENLMTRFISSCAYTSDHVVL